MFEGHPPIADNIYAFNIDVVEGDWNEVITDEKIGVTVVEIFYTVF